MLPDIPRHYQRSDPWFWLFLAHPMDSQSHWDPGIRSLDVILTPYSLCHIPWAVPEKFFAVWQGALSCWRATVIGQRWCTYTSSHWVNSLLWKQLKRLPTWPWPPGPELGYWELFPKAESHITSEEDRNPKSGGHYVWMELLRHRTWRRRSE